MIDVIVNQEQKEYAWRLVKQLKQFSPSYFKRENDNEKIYTGMLGQVVMADNIGHDRPRHDTGFDNGQDFLILGVIVDLKTVKRNRRPHEMWANNLVAHQTTFATQVYVFASLNPHDDRGHTVFTVCGLLPKHAATSRQFYIAPGTTRHRADGTTFVMNAESYEIPNRNLVGVNSWEGLVMEIGRYA